MAASDETKAIGTIIFRYILLPIQFLAELEFYTLINYTVRVVMFLNCFWYYFVKFLYLIESLHKTFFIYLFNQRVPFQCFALKILPLLMT